MSICHNIKTIIMNDLKTILEGRYHKTLKEDNSYISQGDLIIQEKIYNYIISLCDDYIVISEEFDNRNFYYNPLRNYVVVDPLDGTENFVSGLKEWGVGISIYKNDKHNESMILLPELDECLISGSPVSKFTSRIYGLSSSLNKKDIINLSDGYEYRILGCSMYNIYNVIRGSFAVFENVKGVNAWDILPGINLALEHKLFVKVDGEEYRGQFLFPNKKYRIKIQHK